MAFPFIAIQLGVGIGLWALNKYVLNDEVPKTKEKPKALKLPRAGIGNTVPMVYGRTRVKAPVMYWAGNHAITPESETQPSSRRIDILFGIGMPMSDIRTDWRFGEPPRLMAVWINGMRREFSPPLEHGDVQAIQIQDEGNFSGRGAGGEFNADFEFFDGRADQVITGGTSIHAAMDNANLGVPIDEDLVSGFRHQMCASMITSTGAITTGTGTLGEGTNLVSVEFEVDVAAALPVLNAESVYESNPAMVLYDLICGRVWRLGYDTDLVDTDSFDAAADTLIDEEHGMSGVFSVEGDAPALIVEILEQINGIIFEDQSTGKLKLKLIRDDYDPEEIPVLNKANTLSPPEVQFIGWDDLVNQVDVEFTDRSLNYVTNTATAQRGASAVGISNRIRARKVRYPCVQSPTLASILATRELGIAARPLVTAKCKVNRTLYAIEHGDAVVADWDGVLEGKVMRVLDIDHGTLLDGGITLTLIEDVFSETLGGYGAGAPPWGDDPPFEIPEIFEP